MEGMTYGVVDSKPKVRSRFKFERIILLPRFISFGFLFGFPPIRKDCSKQFK